MKRVTKNSAVSPRGKRRQIGSLGRPVGRVIAPGVWTKVIVGFVAAAAVTISILSAPGMIGFLAAGLALVMLAIAIIDWHSFIIPDWLNAAGFCLAVVHAAAQEPAAMVSAVASAAMHGGVLALIFLALRYGYAQLRGRQGLGLGDVKLALVAGAWLDWRMIPVAIELAVFAALSAYGLRQIASSQSISAINRIPFGLFFAPAIWISWVIQVQWLAPF
ncbi:MAG: A24 family peptidase [Pseudolabrys sp.]|jgi:leader peptidase (prepilin peptidase)/N-methyltransferase